MKILVIGDTILDRYIKGTVERISPESPSLVLDFQEEDEYLGGACNVAANIRTLANNPDLRIEYFGIASSREINLLGAAGVSWAGIPTTREKVLSKTRFVASNQHLLRLDRNKKYGEDLCLVAGKVVKSFRIKDYDLVVISDYDKGTISEALCTHIFSEAHKTPVLFDVKKCHDWIFDFKLSNCIFKCNQKEFENNGIDKIPFSSAKNTIVTKGGKGYEIWRADRFGILSEEHPAIKLEGNVADVVGAGDVFLAGMAVKFLETKEFDANALAKFGNICAAEKVKHFGTKTIHRSDIDESSTSGLIC